MPGKGIDRHAVPSALPPAVRAIWRQYREPDPDDPGWWCCTPELIGDRWEHERSCPCRRPAA